MKNRMGAKYLPPKNSNVIATSKSLLKPKINVSCGNYPNKVVCMVVKSESENGGCLVGLGRFLPAVELFEDILGGSRFLATFNLLKECIIRHMVFKT